MSNNEALPIWNLDDLYHGVDDPAIQQDFSRLEEMAAGFEAEFRGRLDNPATVLEALQRLEAINALFSRLRAYAYLEYSTDTDNHVFRRLVVRSDELSAALDEKMIFFRLEILDLAPDVFEAIAAAPRLETYHNYLRQIWKFRPHKLTEPEEVIISKKDLTGKNAFVRLYDELTSAFEFPMTIDGQEETLPASALRSLFFHPDAGLRKQAIEVYYNRYAENANILNNTYNNIVKDHLVECDLRHYADSITPTHMANQVEAGSIELMMDQVTEAYTLVQEYYKLKARIMDVPVIRGSDLYAPVGDLIRDIPFQRAREMVVAAYREFDPDMGEMADGFFERRWIHAPVSKGKRGGAYCYGPGPDLHPWVLTNYTGNLRDVYTLAHELGHGVHDLLATDQTYLNYHPPLVAAETASVFGEMLLTDQLKREISMREQLLWFYCGKIEDIIATVYRQTMYTLFELRSHQGIGREMLSSDELCDMWWEEMTRMYGEAVEFLPDQRWTWASIPHFFHYRFYCYAYSFGELFVLCLYGKYREEGKPFVEKYKQILRSGGSRTPYELVASVGEDLDDPGFWRKGFVAIRAWLDDLKGLV